MFFYVPNSSACKLLLARAIHQIEFYGILKTNSQVCTVLEKTKETVLEFYKGTANVLGIL